MSEALTEAQIKDKLVNFLAENFLLTDEVSLGNNDSFMENGILDSTGILELIGFVEETFCISVKDEEMLPENLDSIQNVLSFVKRKTGISP